MIGITVAIVVLLWLYQDLDIAKFLSSIVMADLVWIIVLGGTILLEQLIRGWKWPPGILGVRFGTWLEKGFVRAT